VDGPVDVSHTEVGIHIEAIYWVEPRPRMEIVLSGGPSVFRVDQDFVSDVTYTQSYPYTTATFPSAALLRERQTVNGFNLGGEVGWKMATHMSLSAGIRFSHATASFSDASATSVTIGGLRVGGGVRFLF